MSQRVEPALGAEQWKLLHDENGTAVEDFRGEVVLGFAHVLDENGRGIIVAKNTEAETGDGIVAAFHTPAVWALIAVANAGLTDSDPRKITRERIADIRKARTMVNQEIMPDSEYRKLIDSLDVMAAALESYLPPVA